MTEFVGNPFTPKEGKLSSRERYSRAHELMNTAADMNRGVVQKNAFEVVRRVMDGEEDSTSMDGLVEKIQNQIAIDNSPRI